MVLQDDETRTPPNISARWIPRMRMIAHDWRKITLPATSSNLHTSNLFIRRLCAQSVEFELEQERTHHLHIEDLILE